MWRAQGSTLRPSNAHLWRKSQKPAPHTTNGVARTANDVAQTANKEDNEGIVLILKVKGRAPCIARLAELIWKREPAFALIVGLR